jgi:hypothetical protein
MSNTDTNQASEDELRQKIYDVLNVHTPAGCAGRHCWGVEALEKLISDQVAKAMIDELEHLFDRADGERSARRYTAILEQRIKVLRTRLKGDNK